MKIKMGSVKRYERLGSSGIPIDVLVELIRNSDAEFAQRLSSKDTSTMRDWEGNRANYKMGSSDNIVYPNVVKDNGRWTDFTRPPYSPQAGYYNVINTGNYVEMPSERDAIWFGENYKNIPEFRNDSFEDGGPTDYIPYVPTEKQPADKTNVERMFIMPNTDYDVINEGVDLSDLIMNVENPDHVGYENGRWYAPKGRGYDKNNRGGGIDIKTSAYLKKNPQALKTDADGRTYITEEDEIEGRAYGISEAQKSLENRIKYAKKVTGSNNEPSEFKKILLTDVIYNAGSGTVASTLFEDKDFMEMFMNGTDEDVYNYIKDYQSNRRGRKERMKLWDNMVYFNDGKGSIDLQGMELFKKYPNLGK